MVADGSAYAKRDRFRLQRWNLD